MDKENQAEGNKPIAANVSGLGVVAEIEKQKYQNGTEVK